MNYSEGHSFMFQFKEMLWNKQIPELTIKFYPIRLVRQNVIQAQSLWVKPHLKVQVLKLHVSFLQKSEKSFKSLVQN